MLPLHKNIRGATLIELLIALSLIMLLGAASAPYASRFLGRNNVSVVTDRIVTAIRTAQTYAMDGRFDETWGVCMSGHTLRTYAASCASPSYSEEYSIPASVEINGLSDVTFSKPRGEPASTLTITVSTSVDSTTVIVNAAGGTEVN